MAVLVRTLIPMRKSHFVVATALLAIAIAGILIYRTQFRGRSDETSKLPEGLGTAVAEAAATLTGGQGKLVLILPKRGNYQDPVVETQRAAFVKALGKTKGLSLAATEALEIERPGTMGAGGLDHAEFRQVLERHPGTDVFVSLAGFPELPKDALPAFQGKKFVIVGSMSQQLKALLLGGVVPVAIVPRSRPPAGDKPPRTPLEWFNFAYETFTPATAGSLP